jgi:NTP pyrophosphatase (non-canonical NTP hydrolase)
MFSVPAFRREWHRMAHRVHKLSCEQGFWDEDRHPTHPIALAMSELGEALEAYREGGLGAEDKNIKDHSGFEVQLADVLGILLDMSEGYGLDLPAALMKKMEFNRTRGRLHGKRY